MKKNLCINRLIYPFHQGDENIMTLFLKKKPAVLQKSIRDDLERGTLSLRLIYKLEEEFANNVQLISIVNDLIFMEGSKEFSIAKTNSRGYSVKLFTNLNTLQCDEVYEAYLGKPSKMFFRSEILLRLEKQINKLSFDLRLDILLHDPKYGGDQSPIMKLNYKYFNLAENGYSDAPSRFWINGFSKAISERSAYLNHGKITSMQVAINPIHGTKLSSAQFSAATTYNSDLKLRIFDDWEIANRPNDQVKDYPVVSDATNGFWINRHNDQEWLAIPNFTLVMPDLNQEFSNAPFSFVFHNLGLDTNGRSVLEGNIALTVNQEISKETLAAAKAADAVKVVKPIELQTIHFSLNIPYFDANQQIKYLIVDAQESADLGHGQTRLIFRLSNSAVRICYGSISADTNEGGYLPLKLTADFSFYGYSAEEKAKLNYTALINSKISAIPLVRSDRRTIQEEYFFDLSKNKLVKKNGEEIIYTDNKSRDVSTMTHSALIHTVSKINSPFVSNVIRPDVHLIQSSALPMLPPIVYKLQTYQRTIELPASFPCNKFGNFYQENNADSYTAIGCLQAYKLGDPPDSLYTEIVELKSSSYQVYRSTISPNQFLIASKRYIIGRHSPVENSINNYKPSIILYSTINTADNTSTWILDCTLVPDITIFDRLNLEYSLKKFTPYTPDIQYLTEIPVSAASAVLSISSMSNTSLSAYSLGKGIRITIETKIESILILLEMLKQNAIDGEFHFTLEDGTIVTTQLSPRLDLIAGLWESGHVETQQSNNGLVLKNISENKISISKIRFYKKGSFVDQDMPIQLDSGKTIPMPTIPTDTQNWAAYYEQDNPTNISLEQINKYIEDVKCQLIFISMIDFQVNKIRSVEVGYRIKDATDTFTATLDAVNNNCEKIILMPMTNFLIQRIIEYKINSIAKDDGTSQLGNVDWIAHDLEREGNVINIQTNLIIKQ